MRSTRSEPPSSGRGTRSTARARGRRRTAGWTNTELERHSRTTTMNYFTHLPPVLHSSAANSNSLFVPPFLPGTTIPASPSTSPFDPVPGTPLPAKPAPPAPPPPAAQPAPPPPNPPPTSSVPAGTTTGTTTAAFSSSSSSSSSSSVGKQILLVLALTAPAWIPIFVLPALQRRSRT